MNELFISTGSITASSCLSIGSTGTLGYVGSLTTPVYDYNITPSLVNGLSYPIIKKEDLSSSFETDKYFVFKYVMPGVRSEDLKAFIRSGNLIVQLDTEKEYPFTVILNKELSLDVDNEDYNTDDIELDLSNGILTIIIAKATPDKQLTIK